jgi:paraquat-inducible protein B
MNRRAWRLGLFTLLGFALLVAAVVAVFGLRVFARSDRAVMHFEGSLYGLSVGAPVMFRGLRLGSVTNIGLAHDGPDRGLRLPVQATLDGTLVDQLLGPAHTRSAQGNAALASLVQRGLRAQLVTQSLLTGQRYIELDLVGAAGVTPAAAPPAPRRADGLTEVPTVAAPQSLQEQIARLDLDGLLQEARGAAAALRGLAGGPHTEQTLRQLGQASQRLGDLAQALQRQVGPLAQSAQATLGQGQRAAVDVALAGQQAASAATHIAAAAAQAEATLAPQAPLPQAWQQAAEELARSATLLRRTLGDESTLTPELQRSVTEVGRAARSLRELAELLRDHPEALLRGAPAPADAEPSTDRR